MDAATAKEIVDVLHGIFWILVSIAAGIWMRAFR